MLSQLPSYQDRRHDSRSLTYSPYHLHLSTACRSPWHDCSISTSTQIFNVPAPLHRLYKHRRSAVCTCASLFSQTTLSRPAGGKWTPQAAAVPRSRLFASLSPRRMTVGVHRALSHTSLWCSNVCAASPPDRAHKWRISHSPDKKESLPKTAQLLKEMKPDVVPYCAAVVMAWTFRFLIFCEALSGYLKQFKFI